MGNGVQIIGKDWVTAFECSADTINRWEASGFVVQSISLRQQMYTTGHLSVNICIAFKECESGRTWPTELLIDADSFTEQPE